MARYCLCIDDFLPARLNKLIHCHWREKYRLKKADQEAVGLAVKLSEVPAALDRRRVSFLFVLGPGRRQGDADGWLKSILDALVSCQLLLDDSPQWLEQGPVEFARGEKSRTVVILEDCS